MGWKSHGMTLHDVPVGSNWIAPNPLDALAIIEPDWPVVRSSSTAWSPWSVSFRLTVSWSPALNSNRSGDEVLNVLPFTWSGSAGPSGGAGVVVSGGVC